MAVGAALYKVRKLTFVTLMGATEGWLLPIVLAIVVLEGNSILRSAENALSYAHLAYIQVNHSWQPCAVMLSLRCGSAHCPPWHTRHLFLLILAHVTCSNYGLPRRRATWLQLLSWLTKRTYKIIILTCVMLAWERYGATLTLGAQTSAPREIKQNRLSSTDDDAVRTMHCRHMRSHSWGRGH